ncbi:YqaE/Pmp3 family membrane protein [Hirschia litorea]|uniref:YqaE/Pmp3 family membrane protein n=1 Tax=Hirschia litorea TaxID=1199156 RepID=A0ABW2IP61_9PROT
MTILSILLPPLGVALARGIGGTFFLNVLLTILGYVPGLVHAIWVVARR